MISNRPLKIAFICHDSGLYGAQKSLLSLLQRLDRDAFDAHALVPSGGPFVEALIDSGISYTVVEMHRWLPCATEWSRKKYAQTLLTMPKRAFKLAEVIRNINADIVYTNTIVNAEGAIAAKIAGKKHIWHIREGIVGNSEIRLRVPPWLVTRAVRFLSNEIIVNSAWLAKTLFGPVNSESISVVHNGIDPESLSRSQNKERSLRAEFALPDGTFLVGIVGAIHHRKGHDTFVKAAALVGSTDKCIKYVVIGDGSAEEKDALKRLSAELSITNDLIFTGWREDVANVIRDLDVVVVASRQEAFGRVGIEAMALSKPVISTRCGGPEEVIQDGVTGFLVPVEDSRAIAEKITLLYEDYDLRKKLGQNGYKAALSSFSESAYAEKLQKIIRKVAQGGRLCAL